MPQIEVQETASGHVCPVANRRHKRALKAPMNIKFTVFFSSILLTACVPYVMSFPKIQAPDATYLHSGCQSGLSPKSIVYCQR